jgi:hypothetical protein
MDESMKERVKSPPEERKREKNDEIRPNRKTSASRSILKCIPGGKNRRNAAFFA